LAAPPGFQRDIRLDNSADSLAGRTVAWDDQFSSSQVAQSRLYWAVIAALIVLTLVEAITAWPAGGVLNDFGAFLGVGRALREGIPPYLVLPTTPSVLVNGSLVPWPNANPPALLPGLYLVSSLQPLAAFRGWYLICLLLYAVLLVALLRKYPGWRTPIGIAILAAFLPFWSSQERGQIYVPLAILSAAAWFSLESGKYRRAGILIGIVVALKPNFALWPGLLLLAGYASAGVWASIVAVGLSVVPVVLYGPGIYPQWFEAIKIGESVDMRIVSSVFSLGAILGHPDWSTVIGVLISGALIATLALWAFRIKPNIAEVSAAAIVAALVIGPITWHGYGLIILPVLLSRRWSWTLTAALALSFFPYNILPFFALVGIDILRRGPDGFHFSAASLLNRG
jgi:Glycosyltransferase family 87